MRHRNPLEATSTGAPTPAESSGAAGIFRHNAVVLLRELVETSEAVAATSGRRAKIEEISALLRRASPDEVPVVVAFLSGDLRQRQIGVGYAALGDLLGVRGDAVGVAAEAIPPAAKPTVTVTEADAAFAAIG